MLSDTHGRHFAYLRLSLSKACNFRCQYCLPCGYQAVPHEAPFLRPDEVLNLAQAFCELGVRKIRLTGGEPTLRPDFLTIAESLAALPGLTTLALTTNGLRLDKRVDSFRRAGINHINVSIDSLDPREFARITGRDALPGILAGIDRALALNFQAVKVNTVLMRGVNDEALGDFAEWLRERPVSLRFIELMPTADNRDFFKTHHRRAAELKQQLEQQGWQEVARTATGGPATELQHADYQGRFGFIEPYAKHFCQSCNRLRVTALGELKLCLFSDSDASLRSLLASPADKEALKERVLSLLGFKEASHHLLEGHYGATKNFANIGG